MLEVSKSSIKEFVDSFIDNAVFRDLDINQQTGLKEFLNNYLISLYETNAKDMIKIINQLNEISPFMIKLALGYGILEEDVVDIVKILFMKINEFFYKKGSFEDLQNVKRILNYYGIDSEIKKVLYNKSSDKFLLEDIYTGEVTDAPFDEVQVPGHLVSREEYSTYTFEDNYQTIVIYIKMNMFSSIGYGMQNPVALLHAYTISKHRSDVLYYAIDNAAHQQSLEEFLFFMQYYYYKYIKLKNPDFQLTEDPASMWNMFITDESDLEVAQTLLTDYLSNEYDNRSGAAYFERVAAQLLNKYKISTKAVTLDDLSQKAHQLDDVLATAIDNITSEDEFIHNINNTIVFIENYVNQLPTTSILDQAVQSTMRYLLMYIIFLMITDFSSHIKGLILKFKKYFLPIYTQFFFDENNAFIIKNLHHRIFVEDSVKQFLRTAPSGVIDPRDKQTTILGPVRRDKLEILDTPSTRIRSYWKNKIFIYDKPGTRIRSRFNSVLDPDDKQRTTVLQNQSDSTDILDSVDITISST